MRRIRFLPDGRNLDLTEPMPASEAAAACDILIEHPCGGKGECSKCRIKFVKGAPEPSEADRRQLDSTLLDQGWRLACQTVLSRSAVIEVPPSGRAVGAKSFGAEELFGEMPWEPVVRVVPFDLPAPTLENQWSDLDALDRALLEQRPGGGGMDAEGLAASAGSEELRLCASAGVVRGLGASLKELGRRGEATLYGRRLVALERKGLNHGVAVDVGSTTVAVGLIDLITGKVVASEADLNPQVRHGGDVIARIQFTNERPDGNLRLHEAVCGVIADLIRRTCEKSNIDSRDVVAAAFCGNAVMTHTLVGADVRSLGHSPYVGAFTRDLDLHAMDLNLPIHPEAGVWVFPQVRSNVGGDAVAAALAIGMDRSEQPLLMIDLGTNSEILLGCRDWLIGTSTAAGPAFEGHNISHGMRAAPGAVDRVALTPAGHLHIRILGGRIPARGLCGSGLIDAVSVLLDAGIVDPSGRMLRAEDYKPEGRLDLSDRLVTARDERPAFVIARPEESADQQPVLLNDLDVRALQLVKGSIRAGAEILMAEAGITPDALAGIHLAGAFGNYLRKTNVMKIGLVPDVPAEKVKFAGNAAGVGARAALLDAQSRERARRIARGCRYIELSAHPEYTESFAEGMGFPGRE